jgi:hypothetical protein
MLEDKPTFFFELREGFKLVWEIKWIAASIAMASFQLMVIVAAEAVLLPIVTRREFHTDSVFALSAAMFSLGGALSALAAIKLKTNETWSCCNLALGTLCRCPARSCLPN